MENALRTFFSSSRYAVAGASSDSRKFGYKVFAWYLAHDITPVPINPGSSFVTISASNRRQKPSALNTYETVATPLELTEPSRTSMSVITPPSITRQLLEDAHKAGVLAVWLQPGSFGKEELELARKWWPEAAIGGTDVPGSRGEDGYCVLVDGEWGLELARDQGSPVKL